LLQLQAVVNSVHISDALLDYLQALLNYTRTSSRYAAGLSPRAGLALKQCAQAWAMMHGRDFALPEDVQAVLPGVVGHRLQSAAGVEASHDAVAELLKAVAV
jgi:MoxR-like ATPase